jgi:protein-S-isoprenylcysteine O-methyltransferase Ste14
MNILGIGPLLAITGVVTGAIVMIFCRIAECSVSLPSPWREWIFWVGITLLIPGGYFWISSAILVKRVFESRSLVQTGVYGLSRNPMYAGFIVFIIPGLALMLNNLLLIAVSVAMFIVFKLRIGREESFLSKEFGVEYERYRTMVPQLIPFVRLRRT